MKRQLFEVKTFIEKIVCDCGGEIGITQAPLSGHCLSCKKEEPFPEDFSVDYMSQRFFIHVPVSPFEFVKENWRKVCFCDLASLYSFMRKNNIGLKLKVENTAQEQ